MRKENLYCPNCGFTGVVSCGTYKVKRTRQIHQRYLCKGCEKKFSSTTFSNTYKDRKKDINHEIFLLISMGVSQRDISRKLKVDFKTVKRKVLEVGEACEKYHKKHLEEAGFSISHLSMDELLTYVKTRLKTISIVGASFAVKNGKVLKPFLVDLRVATFPPTGYVSRIYNDMLSKGVIAPRPDTRPEKIKEVLLSCKKVLIPTGTIVSDDARGYLTLIQETLPNITHHHYKGKKILGSAEEKIATQSLNHTFYSMRGHLRPIQRSLGRYISKKEENLQKILYCYICHINGYDFTAIMNNYPIKVNDYAFKNAA